MSDDEEIEITKTDRVVITIPRSVQHFRLAGVVYVRAGNGKWEPFDPKRTVNIHVQPENAAIPFSIEIDDQMFVLDQEKKIWDPKS